MQRMFKQVYCFNKLGLCKFFRWRLVYTSDEEISGLAKEYENDIKSLKQNLYKLAWYMRGGLDVHNLMSDTDLEDISIINKVVEENIETVKKTNMPLL